jgi:hypothetical protein
LLIMTGATSNPSNTSYGLQSSQFSSRKLLMLADEFFLGASNWINDGLQWDFLSWND